ncbi:MAG: SgcJ/EcaC family oxidoreductase, partial [Nitrososphaeraceae archaeon]
MTGTGVKTEREIKEEANIRIVRQALEALNSGDTSRIHEYISPDYFNHESQVDPIRSKMRGPEEFIDTVKNLRTAFPDLIYEELETFASNDKVISTLFVTGEHLGNLFVIPPTGRKIAYQAVHIHRIGNDGKIVEHRAIRDDLTLMMQLGLVGLTSAQYEPLYKAWKGLKSSEFARSAVNESSVEEDKAAISTLYFQMIDGWNKGSGNIFAAPFAEAGDLVGFDGTYLKGRQNIGSFHQQLFDTSLKGSRLVGKIRDMRFLTNDVAIMHAVGGTIMDGQADIEPERNSIHIIMVKRENSNAGNWFITAFQNTRAQYIGRPQK